MFQWYMGGGALLVRKEELIAMAVRCEACIDSHVEKAVKAGATREQILDMAGVVVARQGGPGCCVQLPKLIEAVYAIGLVSEESGLA